MREIIRFPDFKVSLNPNNKNEAQNQHEIETVMTEFHANLQITINTAKRRKTASKKLRQALDSGSAGNGERRVYLQLPLATDHHNHATGEVRLFGLSSFFFFSLSPNPVCRSSKHSNRLSSHLQILEYFSQAAGFLQRMDGRLCDQMRELVEDGVRGVNEMRRHLRHFVSNVLFKGQALPRKTNGRFFPRKVDVRNGIYESIVKHRWSKIDQENSEKKVGTWQRENPHDNMVFKQYASDQENAPNGDDSDDGGDEDVELTHGNGLLFVHQTEWQSRLLKHYGNELSLLDATYRTTKYALPLFFLVVKTNIDYQIVGSLVLQSCRKLIS